MEVNKVRSCLDFWQTGIEHDQAKQTDRSKEIELPDRDSTIGIVGRIYDGAYDETMVSSKDLSNEGTIEIPCLTTIINV